jgi:FkbM family methyltransferase
MGGRSDLRKLFYRRLVPEALSRPLFQGLNRRLFQIALSGMGVGNHNIERRDERRVLEKLRKLLPAEAVIFDVGANVGQYATIARAAFPKARITSFEPNPAAFAKLQAAAERLGLEVIPMGCGNTVGRVPMFDRSADGGTPFATLVPGVLERTGRFDPARFEVELTTIDQFCEDRGVDQVDLLKIDVEGFEQSVLEGASAMLAGRRIRVIQFEFNEMNLFSRTSMDDIAALLDGYALHRLLYDGSLLEIGSAPAIQRNLFGFQNIVAVRRDDHPR